MPGNSKEFLVNLRKYFDKYFSIMFNNFLVTFSVSFDPIAHGTNNCATVAENSNKKIAGNSLLSIP